VADDKEVLQQIRRAIPSTDGKEIETAARRMRYESYFPVAELFKPLITWYLITD